MYYPHSGQPKIFQSLFFTLSLFRSSTKIIEFGQVKLPENVSSKDGICRKFLKRSPLKTLFFLPF